MTFRSLLLVAIILSRSTAFAQGIDACKAISKADVTAIMGTEVLAPQSVPAWKLDERLNYPKDDFVSACFFETASPDVKAHTPGVAIVIRYLSGIDGSWLLQQVLRLPGADNL